MSPLKRDPWRQLTSGLYVPPLMHRYPGFPCGGCDPNPCACAECSGDIPRTLEVEFDGIVDGSCADCDDLNTNGTPFIAPCSLSLGCFWEHELPSTVCAANFIWVFARFDFLGNNAYTLDVTFSTGVVFIARYEVNFGASKPDCSAWSSLNVPFDADGGGSLCDYTSSTCTVTAV